jgi:hypothetical protein
MHPKYATETNVSTVTNNMTIMGTAKPVAGRRQM